MYEEIMEALVTIMQDMTDLPVRRGALPAGNAVCLEKGTNDVVSTALDRSTVERAVFVLNAKHSDMHAAQTALDNIHQKITRMKEYPATDKWQIATVTTVAGPSCIGREPGMQWLFGSSIRVLIYNKESESNG